MMQRAFQIDRRDNVATALCQLVPGEAELLGDTERSTAAVTQEISDGHKLALCRIHPGEPVIKYGVVIGEATAEIEPGTWVHLHCMKSLYDERSSHLDLKTGAPLDTRYK